MKLSSPILSSLCALTLLVGCAKDNNPAPVAGGQPVVVDDGINDGVEVPFQIDRESRIMIRMGLRQANQERAQAGLMLLAHDVNLTIEAQRIAQEIRQRRNHNFQSQGVGHEEMFVQDQQGQFNQISEDGNFRRRRPGHDQGGPIMPPPQQQQPGFGGLPMNIAWGVRRGPFTAFNSWKNDFRSRNNLFNMNFRRHGMGYADGVLVHVFAN